MPFTNVENVRQHLSATGVGRDSYRDVPLQLVGTSAVALAHVNLKSGSVQVKGKEIGSPRLDLLTLADEPVNLSGPELIPDSVVVARDSSLGEIYTENVDYSVDYQAGTITRISSGAIASGDTVAVWYYCYHIHTEGEDYSVNLAKGTIRRLSGGTIEDGQVIYVDYETQSGFFVDSQIAQAISEADDRLLAVIDSSYHNSTDQTLVIAETYLAVAILCRMKAISSLDRGSGVTSGRTAESWLKLADRYEFDGLKAAAAHVAAKSSLATPTAIKGGGKE
ncbi:MAG: hypothetical protein KAT58_11050 [candidate division Zixibacteria bacterium]|nr:hypothetical protein [candidate division Zixibacteria bacterium]